MLVVLLSWDFCPFHWSNTSLWVQLSSQWEPVGNWCPQWVGGALPRRLCSYHHTGAAFLELSRVIPLCGGWPAAERLPRNLPYGCYTSVAVEAFPLPCKTLQCLLLLMVSLTVQLPETSFIKNAKLWTVKTLLCTPCDSELLLLLLTTVLSYGG